MSEVTFVQKLKQGAKGREVKRVQEWLSLHGLHVVVDGDFGPATRFAVSEFQNHAGLARSGVVDRPTFEHLVAPMRRAVTPLDPGSRSLGALVVACARQHLKEHPREVGGQNMGPWVRLYMNGRQGAEWAWCAGFACYVLTQACDALGVAVPLQRSVSCDVLAAGAKDRGRFVKESAAMSAVPITPGSLFLQRRTPSDWTHTGIVVAARDDVFESIEGNTNDEGSREGFEVCRRIRGYAKKDFVLVASTA